MPWDTLPAYFISVLAHGTMLILALTDTDEYVLATLPLDGWNKRQYTDVETSLIVAIALGLAFCALEIISLTVQLISPPKAIFSMCLHLLASCFLLKFIIDSHPVEHFWIVFAFFSTPSLLITCCNICMHMKVKEYC